MGLDLTKMQRTLAERVLIEGTGLHSGNRVSVTIHPAEADEGIIFAGNGERCAGIATNVVATSRGTTLGCNGTSFATVEHLMAALNGLGIDNSYIEVNGPEMPILDGSAMPYVEAINSVGTVELEKERNILTLREPVWVEDSKGGFILAVPANKLRITYVMKYEHPLIGTQTATHEVNEKNFKRDIAPARTFVIYEEIAGLISQHLARGGNIANAIVIWQDRLSSDLRFPDELARHKVLDLVGDIALVGGRLAAEIVAVKSGHALNVKFAKKLSDYVIALDERAAA